MNASPDKGRSVGSTATEWHKSVCSSAVRSRISLCRTVGKPPKRTPWHGRQKRASRKHMRQEWSSAANCTAGLEHPKTPAYSAETHALLVEAQLAKLKPLGQTVTPNISGCSLIPKGGLGVCRQQFFASRLQLLLWSCSQLKLTWSMAG